MSIHERGFVSMKDRALQKEIAAKGGRTAHENGTAHVWTSEEARAAGRKGWQASARNRRIIAAAPSAYALIRRAVDLYSINASEQTNSTRWLEEALAYLATVEGCDGNR